MELSPKLSAKFEKLQTSYPVKRSALIPMLMYAQDEFGYISDEMIDEIGRRLDLNNVQIEETLAYYSMLRRKPMGRTACSRSKKSSASARARAHRPCR